MFAVMKTGGKQYKVQAGDVLRVEKLAADAGETVQFNDILMLGGDSVTVGARLVAGAAVQAEVTAWPVRAEFANPQHRLLPGGSVTILFRPQELPSRVMVPAAAVQQDPQGFFSWVLKPDHTAGQRRLTLAGQQGPEISNPDAKKC